MLLKICKRRSQIRFGWDFDAVVQNQKDVWNGIFNRLDITTNDRLEKGALYTNVSVHFAEICGVM